MPAAVAVTCRPGRETDLDACARVWRDALDAYQRPLGLPAIAVDLGPLKRLLRHLLCTDPDRFWVAEPGDGSLDPASEAQGGDAPRLIGFSSATVRGGTWFLAMLFVAPDAQRAGVGAALLDRAQAGRDAPPGGPAVPGPDQPFDTGITAWGMCTDAAQPISNGMYAARGMLSRLPVWRLAGEPRRWSAIPPLPRTLESVPFEALAANGHDGARRLADLVDEVDLAVLGYTHQEDHEYLRRDGRLGFLARDRVTGRPMGYGYGSPVGRIGPVTAIDPALQPSLLGTIVRDAPVMGTMAVWVPGTCDAATRALLAAGLRYEGFPALVCWTGAEHPFTRYIPISLALV